LRVHFASTAWTSGRISVALRQYGLTVRPAQGVEVAGSPTLFVG
jgi:hypothetical protein